VWAARASPAIFSDGEALAARSPRTGQSDPGRVSHCRPGRFSCVEEIASIDLFVVPTIAFQQHSHFLLMVQSLGMAALRLEQGGEAALGYEVGVFSEDREQDTHQKTRCAFR
jgi:hypothetical protein